MSEFKPGDRVRVEFEGVVSASDVYWSFMRHSLTGQMVTVKTDDCTLIEPGIVLPEAPGTIVQIDPLDERECRTSWERQDEYWWESGGSRSWSTAQVIEKCREFGYRVIPAAEAVTE